MEKLLDYKNCRIKYKINDKSDTVVITGLVGNVAELFLPDTIEGRAVCEIERKAFLSCKSLKKIGLPKTINRIDDWAFAYCNKLREVELNSRSIVFGKAVFLDCDNLQNIYIENKANGISSLLALAITKLNCGYLLDIEEAGSDEWIKKLDAAISSEIDKSDEEGFSKQILCGEEDYESTNKQAYTSGNRTKKVEIIFERLLHDIGLEKELRDKLKEYLKRHTKGCVHEEACKVVLEKYSHDKKYYEIFFEAGCVNSDNLDMILKDIGDSYPEFKAAILKYKEENLGYNDFFESLSLSFL